MPFFGRQQPANVQLSLKLVLIVAIAALAFAGMGLLTLTSIQFQKLIYTNKTTSIIELGDLNASLLIKELTKSIIEFAMSIQTRTTTRERIKTRDSEGLRELLNGSFKSHLVTSGRRKLQRIYIFDDNFSLMAKSSEGLRLKDDDRIICAGLLKAAQTRIRADRHKPISSLCVEDGYGLLAVVVTIASFKPLGYILIASDVGYTLGAMHESLGAPVFVTHPNGETASVSEDWNEEVRENQNDDAYLFARWVKPSRSSH